MVIFGLPSTALGTWIIWSLRQKHQYKIKQLNLEKEQLLLNLIQQNEGEITVTRFALVAQIPIAEAKAYLDEKAKQLNADFEASDEGGMIYKFPQ
jgi:predicted HTH domain antitoxin